jgi:hypothetical protein
MLSVVARSFQIFCHRTESQWKVFSSAVIRPDVCHLEWDAFTRASELIEAGECAAEQALPEIRSWFPPEAKVSQRQMGPALNSAPARS